MNFETRYQKLNKNQKQAVDCIDGPVMVVAGPGTGKTELLSMRAANILRQTDMLPENILCLTFTDSGSVAMQKRLTDIIGQDAYKVGIFTFHAFGSEVMAHWREYFYQGAEFSPADELTRHDIISQILDELPPKHPLASKLEGEFTQINNIIKAISDIKRAGLTPGELTVLLDANQQAIEAAEPILLKIFDGRVNKSTFGKLNEAADELAQINEPQAIATFPRLSDTLRASLQRMLAEAANHPKTTPPITKWKNEWLGKSPNGEPVLKARLAQEKLYELAKVYQIYLDKMQNAKLYDFDDMISNVVHAIETHADLRAELQEKYQYIMVDEFQDTNHAQMRILHNLTNLPSGDAPNLLVVGDDDQAIYGFQGADIGNILDFTTHYKDAKLITLTDNYRSANCILASAREVISQGTERLEYRFSELNKTLTAHASSQYASSQLVTLPNASEERAWVASKIKSLIDDRLMPGKIAILARRHADLVALLPHLAQLNIPVSYDRNDNVLDDELIQLLIELSQLIIYLANGEHSDAEAMLPKLLAHPALNIPTKALWQISLKAYKNRQNWLEVASLNDDTVETINWLIACAKQAKYLPMERMIDVLLGTDILEFIDSEVEQDTNAPINHVNNNEAFPATTLANISDFLPADDAARPLFKSPLAEYYFKQTRPSRLTHLQNLNTIRTKLREHDPQTTQPTIINFINFIEKCHATNTAITAVRHIGQTEAGVNLMSAHGSKGLEFDTVFILDASDTSWGSKARGGSGGFSYPANLRLSASTSSYEERLRLFFVGMTRAKRQLFISRSELGDNGKELLLASFLTVNSTLEDNLVQPIVNQTTQTNLAAIEWYTPIISQPAHSLKEELASMLATYQLSATHLNAFCDITKGTPQEFLLHNLLRFPQARSSYASFGTAVHEALSFAHNQLIANKKLPPTNQIIEVFSKRLQREPLTAHEFAKFNEQGTAALSEFMAAKQGFFNINQRTELEFQRQESRLGDVRLTGKLDVVEIDKQNRTIAVVDYKTGTPIYDWHKGTDYQKVKAHKYRQQLLFYKLLIETSRDWHNFTFDSAGLQFVEADKAGEIIDISLEQVSDDEFNQFKALVQAVWGKIQNLDMPDVSEYSQNLAGILQFEEDLIRSSI